MGQPLRQNEIGLWANVRSSSERKLSIEFFNVADEEAYWRGPPKFFAMIDPETGEVKLEKYTACDDFGRIVNPMIVEGQVHGGLAQGIGQALYENAEYDVTGQLMTGSYMDYTMPRADNFPEFNIGYTCTHATSNPLGVKGCGEAGAIAAPPTVMNAVIDAVGSDVQMPATAEKVWKALKKNGSKKAAA